MINHENFLNEIKTNSLIMLSKPDIRYYMGRHMVLIKGIFGKKALIFHLEKGKVGNQNEGYKKVKRGDQDIVLIRNCYKHKFE